MAIGFLFLGDSCPGISQYHPQGNATLNEKQAFWKDCCIQLAMFNMMSMAILCSLYLKQTNAISDPAISDPAFESLCRGTLQTYGPSMISISLILSRALQSPNELTRLGAHKIIVIISLLFFSVLCTYKLIDAALRYKNVAGVIETPVPRATIHTMSGG